VLLDVHLPDTNGPRCRPTRAAGHTTDVIMVTQARDLSVVRAIAPGAMQKRVWPFTSGAAAPA
jgi:response regulator of citrate/malate metabolism